MDLKSIAKATAATLVSYLTYQAMRTVYAQLRETDPFKALWLSQFSPTEKFQDGELYLTELLKTKPELAFRIMTVREHIANEVVEFLPEMVQTQIQQTNMDHRRDHLERITQLSDPERPSDHPEA